MKEAKQQEKKRDKFNICWQPSKLLKCPWTRQSAQTRKVQYLFILFYYHLVLQLFRKKKMLQK